jgi:hypothetical protein
MVIVQRVLDDNKIAFSREGSMEEVCDASQCGKSRQLSFPKSFSVFKAPLDLVFQMCGGQPLVRFTRIITM